MSNEEIVLMIRAGDREQLPDLWERVKRFCFMTIYRYRDLCKDNIAVSMEDLQQECYVAMVDAVEHFKPEAGGFLTILDFYVRGRCRAALGLQGRAHKEHYCKDSIDEPGKGEDTRPLKDLLEDTTLPGMTDELELDELQKDVRKAVSKLPDSDEEIIRRHYLEGEPIKTLADQRGVTSSWIQAKKLTALEQLSKDERMKEYAEISFHRHKGVRAFRSSQSSVVEDAVLLIEAMRERRQAQINKMIREAREEMIAHAWGKPLPSRAPAASGITDKGTID